MSNLHRVKIGSTDITSYVFVEGIKPFGGKLKSSLSSIPGSRRYSLYDEGIVPRGWTLNLRAIADSQEDELDAILAAFNGAAEDTKFYPFFPTKFARILKATAWEDECLHYSPSLWKAEVEVYVTLAELFAEAATIWYPTSNETKSILPAGTVAAPLDEIEIIGCYNGGHVEDPTLEIWNAAGTTLEDSLLITSMLLTDETLTLDYQGKITQVYSDDFSSTEKFTQDAEAEACMIGEDGLEIDAGGAVVYLLSGPWPLTSNIVITGVITGSGYLQYSYDNSTWKTAISRTDLSSSTSWTIPNTAGHGDVYIRFSSYSGGTDSEERTEDTILAEILAAVRDRDTYYKGIWGRVLNASTYMFIVKLDSTKFAYQIQQAGEAILTNAWAIGTDYEASVALYNASIVVETPDRTDAQILTDITTPSPAKDRDTYYKGVWGRVSGASTYAYVIKLDSSKYAYQIQQTGAPVLTNTWYIGTDIELADALYAASIIIGDRDEADILADITGPDPDRDTYYKGIWGKVLDYGAYMYIIRVGVSASTGSIMYAYQLQNGAPILTNPWGIGTADQAASALYAASTASIGRTAAQIQAELTNSPYRDRDNYYAGVWGRTYGSGAYMFMVKLAADRYAYQLQTSGGAVPTNPWYIGSAWAAAVSLYNSSSGTRTIANIEADIANTIFGNPASELIHFHVYGYYVANEPVATIIQVNNLPKVFAYKISYGGDTEWAIDSVGGAQITAALLAAYPPPALRTQANIKADIDNAGLPAGPTHQWAVDGSYSNGKPSAVVVQINNSPQAFAYVIFKPDGTISEWAIDDQAGHGTVTALMAATPSVRTAASIRADLLATVFLDPSTYSYAAYGYVLGARPVATIIQLNNSPQKLAYRIENSDGTSTEWALEENAGVDCRALLIAGFAGVSTRTQEDIRADITNAGFVSPTTYDWQVHGLDLAHKPYANIIQVNDTPRVFAYQVDYLSSGLSDWAIDLTTGATIAALLEAASTVASEADGALTLRSMTITQHRRIPWQELPVIPLDGLARLVKLLNGPSTTGSLSPSLIQAVGATVGETETFTLSDAGGGKYYIQANTGKYLSSSWSDDYVSAAAATPGANEVFDIIVLGSGTCAIRCSNGKYLSVTDAGAGFVLTTAIKVGWSEIFVMANISGDDYSFRCLTPSPDNDALVIDTGTLDSEVLDGAIEGATAYAGKYLSAVPGTVTGVVPVTMTYRDRYYI